MAASDALSLRAVMPVPQVAVVVFEVIWTVYEAPGASVAGPHESTPLWIEQFAAPLSIDQVTPGAVGRVSVSKAALAGEPPVLLAVTVKPMLVGAATPVESGVSVTPKFGALGAGV